MIAFHTQLCDVPVAAGTVFTIRETSSYQRTLVLANKDLLATLTLQLQYSTDNQTWTNLGSSFDLGPAGGGSDVANANVTNANLIRLRGSGGNDDQELEVGYLRYYSDATEWVSPAV